MVKLLPTILLLLLSTMSNAKTVMMERGPPPVVTVKRDFNLYDIYVTPPPTTPTYTPGVLSVYLSREYPDFMRVPLLTDRLADGRIQ